MTFPVAEMSCPAPAVVWQALRSGTTAKRDSVVKPIMSLWYMLESFVIVLHGGDDAIRTILRIDPDQ
jgi:hypothetical protein